MTKGIQIKKIIIGTGIPKICIPITGENSAEIISQAEQIASAAPDLVEWRADFFNDIFNWRKVKKILAAINDKLGEIPLIFTFRSEKEGGKRQISLENYVNLNILVSETAWVQLVDVEIFQGIPEAAGLIEVIHRNGKRVIASNHNFQETPNVDELLAIFAKMEGAGGDILKIAVMPKIQEDVLTLLAATNQMKQRTTCPLITMSMGLLGMPSRICGAFFGSAVTFAALGAVSAPGQMEYGALKEILGHLHAGAEK